MGAPIKLGRLLCTRGVMEKVKAEKDIFDFVMECVLRHEHRDWGKVPPEDKILNDMAADRDERLLSSYKFRGLELWVVTEADRSVTTVLLPSEY